MPMKNPFAKKPWWWTALLITTILLLVPIWYFHFLPLNDWPNHLAGVYLVVQNDAGHPSYVEANPDILLPNSTDFWFMRILGPFVGVETSGRIVLSITIILMIWGSAYFFRQIHPDLEALGGAGGAALAYNWFFLMGFLNFALSIPIFLIACGYWMRVDNAREKNCGGNKRDYAFAIALAALATFTHLVAGLVLIAIIGIIRVVEAVQAFSKNKNRGCEDGIKASMRHLRWDAAFAAPVLLISILSLPSLLAPESGGNMIWNGPLSALNYLLHTPPNPALAIVFIVVAATNTIIWITSSKRVWGFDAKWLALAALLAAGGMLLPESTATWQFAAPRLWPFFIYAAIASIFLPLAKSGAKQLFAELTVALLILTLAQTGLLMYGWAAEQPRLSAIASVADHLQEGAAVFPVGEGFAMTGEQSGVSPYFHAWGYWVMQKGVFVPYVFAEDYTPLKYKDPAAHDREELDNAIGDLGYKVFAKPTDDTCKYWKEYYQALNWTRIGHAYDYVVLRTGECENASIVPKPFALEWAAAPLYVFKNENKTK